jgi:formyltetrahydrofolate deformylase
MKSEFVLTLSCPDVIGIVHAVASLLVERSCNIVDSAQFGDAATGRFFMRVTFIAPESVALGAMQAAFMPIAARFKMDIRLYDRAVRPRVLIMVSKFGHCLNDLVFRAMSGALPIEIRAIVSNHGLFGDLAAAQRIPFHHQPVTTQTKVAQEARLAALCDEERIDLIVLARYMQVLSDDLCRHFAGRAINIHHSFLPSFKGAKPYHQAFERGVKLIGATAHYVTPELDEGPIIEQEVIRVDHSIDPDRLVEVGRDVECNVLARAVKLHVEHRVLLNGIRTVVFK